MPTHGEASVVGSVARFRVAGRFGGVTTVSVRGPDQGVHEGVVNGKRRVALVCFTNVEFVVLQRQAVLLMSSLPIKPGTYVREPLIARPLVVLGAPRSGTTMIFQALSTHPDLWSLYRESQAVIGTYFPTEMVPGCSVFVSADDVDDATADAIQRSFYDSVGNAEASHRAVGRRIPLIARARLSKVLTRLGGDRKTPPIRIVEKTPDNCFRIEMLLRAFPDAQFVYVVRDPRGSIASIYRGWTEESRFQRFELPPGFTIKGYPGTHWCFGLPPGWEGLDGSTVMEICAHQWRLYNEYCGRDLPTDPGRVFRIRYEEVAADPGPVLAELARWAELDPVPLERYSRKLPVVNTWTRPSADKWRKVEREISEVLPLVADESQRLGYPAA